MEEIKVSINEDYMLDYINVYGENVHDYISKGEYYFKFGKIYGIICEQGAGGEVLSQIITNKLFDDKTTIFIDGIKIDSIYDLAWYVGKGVRTGGLFERELSVQKALELAIKKNKRYENIDKILEEFHLSRHRIKYCLSNMDVWERWRASIAIGYAQGKQIYCFPWMDSLYFYDCMINSSVFRFFKKITGENGLIILPTAREKNVKGLADEIVKINCPRFEHCISESEYFKKYFL